MQTSQSLVMENEIDEVKGKSLDYIVFWLGFTLNISQVFFGINIAVSDFFMVFLFIHLLVLRKIYFTKNTLLFFMLVIALRLISTIYLSVFLNISMSAMSILITFQKFVMGLLYFTITISVAKKNPNLKQLVFKGLKYGAFILGGISLVLFAVGPTILRTFILFGDMRLKGFMNDPNYFAYLQICGYCIWAMKPFRAKVINMVAGVVFVSSILLSASKTGLIVFLLLNLLLLGKKIISVKLQLRRLTVAVLFLGIGLSLFYLFFDQVIYTVARFTQTIPQLARLNVVFSNFNGAINDGGSGRFQAWETAEELITGTHFMGIGFMDYSAVARSISGSPIIAHNTFLQLAVEWGVLPLIFGLFFVLKASINKLLQKNWLLLFLITINLVFSFSVSLQNSRLLWIVLAMLFIKEDSGRMTEKITIKQTE
ncbi:MULTISPECIES: O-antigen ligase family protein [unclassified Enterococcus]|uniref:O-antigen ligase family protein n=1 Tax=unclassified Enterococcus TaxID=2608891 RepID=UPI001F14C82D|nr:MULTISPECIES: O-antigen ligase family protein [unclassified Enterococcus]